MSEQLKSTIRHILTALGVVLGFIGLGNLTGLIELIIANLDTIFSAVTALIGVVMAIIGFFKDKGRFEDRTEGVKAKAAKA